MMHLAVTTGNFLAMIVAMGAQSQVHLAIMSLWNWLKSLFVKKISSSRCGLWFVFRKKKSPQGDEEVEVRFAFQREPALSTPAVPPQINGLLKEFPAALGCEHLTVPTAPIVPAVPAYPDAAVFLQPLHEFAPLA